MNLPTYEHTLDENEMHKSNMWSTQQQKYALISLDVGK